MDIAGGNPYPSNALSNFAPHPFEFDGIECASMEGFLQSLKFKSPEMQKEVCKMVGKAAKMKGKNKNWHKSQTLWWKGQPIDRHSKQYQDLLDAAYWSLAENSGFQKALLATHNAVLTHNIGRTDESKTVLTRQEFTSRLTKIRTHLQSQQKEIKL